MARYGASGRDFQEGDRFILLSKQVGQEGKTLSYGGRSAPKGGAVGRLVADSLLESVGDPLQLGENSFSVFVTLYNTRK